MNAALLLLALVCVPTLAVAGPPVFVPLNTATPEPDMSRSPVKSDDPVPRALAKVHDQALNGPDAAAKEAAWCKLAKLRGKNPYKAVAEHHCRGLHARRLALSEQSARLIVDYSRLRRYLGRKTEPGMTDPEGAAVKGFMEAYGAVRHPLVNKVREKTKPVEGGAVTEPVRLGAAEAIVDKRCAEGDHPACYHKGLLHELQLTAGATVDKAVEAYQGACKAGVQAACTRHAALLELGRGVEADPNKALRAYTAACRKKHGPACGRAAFMTQKGFGTRANAKAARKLYTQACDLGDADSCAALGLMHWEDKDFAAGTELQRFACTWNSPRGCNNLAWALDNGRGVDSDPAAARKLYGQACDAGWLLACANLGRNHLQGRGVTQDGAKAEALFSHACDGGSPQSCRDFAKALANGAGVDRDGAKAAGYYAKACQLGDASSCVGAGNLLERLPAGKKEPQRIYASYQVACKRHEEGLPAVPYVAGDKTVVDLARAFQRRLYQSLVMGGGIWGCHHQARALQKGIGVEANADAALALYTKACDAGVRPSCTEKGWLLRNVKKDYRAARATYKKGCRDKIAACCSDLGLMELRGLGGRPNAKRALPLLEQGCEGGDMYGCSNLGALYEMNQGVPVDHAKSAAMYEKACAGGVSKACANLGYKLLKGQGVEADKDKARRYLEGGCRGGDMEACETVEKMKKEAAKPRPKKGDPQ